jgi:hypothetical protein
VFTRRLDGVDRLVGQPLVTVEQPGQHGASHAGVEFEGIVFFGEFLGLVEEMNTPCLGLVPFELGEQMDGRGRLP